MARGRTPNRSWPKPGTYDPEKLARGEEPTPPGIKRPRGRPPNSTRADVNSAASHRRLLEQEAHLYAQMIDAEQAGDMVAADIYRTAWTKLAVAIGSSESKELKNALHRGDLLNRTEADRAFGLLIGHLPEVIRAEIKDLAKTVPGMPSVEVWGRIVDETCDRIFSNIPTSFGKELAATE